MRVCFTLRVREECIEQYRERHRDIWPEMRDALERSGRSNYSLFLADNGTLIGYYETASIDESAAFLSSQTVVARWNEFMAPLFLSPVPERVPEVFRL